MENAYVFYAIFALICGIPMVMPAFSRVRAASHH